MKKISQNLYQKQSLSPRQIIEADLLQLGSMSLEQRILKEVQENPVLELLDENYESDIMDDQNESEESDLNEDELNWDELFQNSDEFRTTNISFNKHEGLDALDFLSASIDELWEQISELNLNSDQLIIAEEIVGNLDDSGYLTIVPILIADKYGYQELEVLNIIKKIQNLDPPGIAAQSLQECLLLQLKREKKQSSAYLIIDKFFEEFVKHKFKLIIEKTGLSKIEFDDAINVISRLNPKPLDNKGDDKTPIIIPDIFVAKKDGKWITSFNHSLVPNLEINHNYKQMAKDPKLDKKTASFIKSKVESGKWFIDALKKRSQTIINVMDTIISFQSSYFNSNNKLLKPLILKDVAEAIEMDISTVSRTTKDKYVQMPWGVKELKFFFSEGINLSSGGLISNKVVKDRIKTIIDNEDKKNPYTDKDLTSILQSEGYKIARRTVSKYRENLNYLKSNYRRKL